MKRITFLLGIILFANLIGCKKTNDSITNNSCFDAALKEQYKNAFCTQDCPGITGCDGKVYCNACEAARQGIKPR
jgi:hypothetical protein